MKRSKVLLAAFSCILFSTQVKAQWQLSGNANATNLSFLGTTNSVPLRIGTNGVERIRVATNGNVGIANTTPAGRLTVQGSGGVPNAKWVSAGTPIFAGFGENNVGNADFILSMGSNTAMARGVFFGRRARGTLAAPAAVQANDYLTSVLASGYDGSNFLSPAAVDFFVDGAVGSGSVPGRISFSTGTSGGTRVERLTIKSNGFVGVGTTSPINEFDVIGRGRFSNGLTVETNGIYTTHSSGSGIEAYGNFAGLYGNGYYGSYATSNNENGYGSMAYGGYGGAYGYGTQLGVYGYTPGGRGADGVFYNSGVFGYNNASGIGVASYCRNGSGVLGYSETYVGVWGQTGNSDSWAGYFAGKVYSSGSYEGSDKKLKENISDISSAMDIINQLKPKTYTFRHDGNYKMMNLPKGKHFGLLAQDLELVLPELVMESKFDTKMANAAKMKVDPKNKVLPDAVAEKSEIIDFKAVKYTELIPILVKALQEQNEKITMLEEQVKQLSANRNSNSTGIGSLGLVTPNPVRGNARIQYEVPESAANARMLITDALGRSVKVLQLSRGGVVDLDASALAAGVYNYSLVVDGKTVTTKKMTVVR